MRWAAPWGKQQQSEGVPGVQNDHSTFHSPLSPALSSYAWARPGRRIHMDTFLSYQQYCHGNPANATESGRSTKVEFYWKQLNCNAWWWMDVWWQGSANSDVAFFVCPVLCKWDVFPNEDCSDNDLKRYFCFCSVPGCICIEFVHR